MAVAVEAEDTEEDLEEAADSAEGEEAAAPLQEFVPFSCPRVAVCVEKC